MFKDKHIALQCPSLWYQIRIRSHCTISIHTLPTRWTRFGEIPRPLQAAKPVVGCHSPPCTRRRSFAKSRRFRSTKSRPFCRSPVLAGNLHYLKINNDMVAAVIGKNYKRHQMEFVSQSYGGSKASKTKKASSANTRVEMRVLNTFFKESIFLEVGPIPIPIPTPTLA
jgi:hypothetical protein